MKKIIKLIENIVNIPLKVVKAVVRSKILKNLPANSVCAEIGVYKGGFSQKILKFTRPKKLHLIDPWSYQEEFSESLYGNPKHSQNNMDSIYESVCSRFENEISSQRVVIHRQDSQNASSHFSDGYFDWVYIDGNHTYEFVKKDLDSYASKVKSGGWIICDDYNDGGWWQGGVKRAADEFVADKENIKQYRVIGNQMMIQLK